MKNYFSQLTCVTILSLALIINLLVPLHFSLAASDGINVRLQVGEDVADEDSSGGGLLEAITKPIPELQVWITNTMVADDELHIDWRTNIPTRVFVGWGVQSIEDTVVTNPDRYSRSGTIMIDHLDYDTEYLVQIIFKSTDEQTKTIKFPVHTISFINANPVQLPADRFDVLLTNNQVAKLYWSLPKADSVVRIIRSSFIPRDALDGQVVFEGDLSQGSTTQSLDDLKEGFHYFTLFSKQQSQKDYSAGVVKLIYVDKSGSKTIINLDPENNFIAPNASNLSADNPAPRRDYDANNDWQASSWVSVLICTLDDNQLSFCQTDRDYISRTQNEIIFLIQFDQIIKPNIVTLSLRNDLETTVYIPNFNPRTNQWELPLNSLEIGSYEYVVTGYGRTGQIMEKSSGFLTIGDEGIYTNNFSKSSQNSTKFSFLGPFGWSVFGMIIIVLLGILLAQSRQENKSENRSTKL